MVVEIESFDYLGRGVARIDNKVTFVIDALPFEVVEIKIIEEKKKYNVAVVTKYLKKSKQRVKYPCPYYQSCGGCHLGSLSIKDQLAFKKQQVEEDLKRAGFSYSDLNIVSSHPFYYRNKITLHSDGNHLGFYQEKTHELIPIKKCLLVNEQINQQLSLLPKNRDIMVRVNIKTGEILRSDQKGYLDCSIGKYTYQVSPFSFFQVNDEITKKLYDTIYETVKRKKLTRVLDLYCGIGTIGIYIHDLVKEVLGIEIVKEAVEDAKRNKEKNHVENIQFLCGDVSSYIDHLKTKFGLIIVDPPRKGLSSSVIEDLIRMNPDTILYISCNKNTLFRDLKKLAEYYDLENMQLFDMFPNTYHVEIFSVLKRKKI